MGPVGGDCLVTGDGLTGGDGIADCFGGGGLKTRDEKF